MSDQSKTNYDVRCEEQERFYGQIAKESYKKAQRQRNEATAMLVEVIAEGIDPTDEN